MWEEISRRSGKEHPKLSERPELPITVTALWNHYIEISHGLEKITYSDIHAYEHVNSIKFMPVEARAIIRIDKERQKWLLN